MFYCNKCQAEREWPISMFLSSGACEVCGAVGRCHDVPSSELPLPKAEGTDPMTDYAQLKTTAETLADELDGIINHYRDVLSPLQIGRNKLTESAVELRRLDQESASQAATIAELEQKLSRYAMSAGAADQYKGEAFAARDALGLSLGETVSPSDITEGILSLRQQLAAANERAETAERELAEAERHLIASKMLDDDDRTEAKIWRRHRDAFLSRRSQTGNEVEKEQTNDCC